MTTTTTTNTAPAKKAPVTKAPEKPAAKPAEKQAATSTKIKWTIDGEKDEKGPRAATWHRRWRR